MRTEPFSLKAEEQKVTAENLLETLAEALAHAEESVRAGAAREVAKRKEMRAIPLLLDALKDEDAGVRLASAEALGELGWRPKTDDEKAFQLVALQKFEMLSELGKSPVPALESLLRDKEIGLRLAAVEMLGQIEYEDAVGVLSQALNDKNPNVRAVAVQALSKRGGTAMVAERIAGMIRDSSWEVRSMVLDVLEGFSFSKVVDAVVTALGDESVELRIKAAELLGRLGQVRAITGLTKALVDENANVRGAAEAALCKLDIQWSNTDFAKEATVSLLSALKHKDDAIRRKAADVLRMIGQVRAMNSYLTAEMGTSSNAAVPILVNALNSASRDLRQAAAEALGKIGDASAIPKLVAAMADEHQAVRESALYALNLMDWKPANDLEIVLKAVVMQRWDTVAVFDSVAFEPLTLVLNSDDPEVCRAAIGVLAQIREKRACGSLSKMLSHPQKSVRAAAARALHDLEWLPSDAREGVLQAIELEDWSTVSQYGASAVEPLIAAIKENYQNREYADAASNALAGLTDGQAAKPLLAYSRDGQLAEYVITALTNMVENHPDDVPSSELRTMTELNNIFQFRYAFDPRYGSYVRSGLQEVDSSKLKKIALQELARRGEV